MKKEKKIYSNNYSGIRCHHCSRMTTEEELTKSVRLYGRPLCFLCYSLEYYRLKAHSNAD